MSKPYYFLSSRTADPVLGVVETKVKETGIGETLSLQIPKLLVGTLDNLMSLSDDLAKADTVVESITKRIAQQHEDLVQKKPDLTVKGATPEDYLTHFSWEHERYSIALQLKLVLSRIIAISTKIDEELRTKSGQYTNLAREIASDARKDGTNLMTKPLVDVVKAENFVETDYLTTLLVVVPKFAFADWNATYQTLTEFVLPNSSVKIAEDSEYGLFSVTLFRKFVEDYKNMCREKRFTVRDYSLDMLKKELATDRSQKEKERDELKARLLRWCQANFGETYSAWVHIKVMRIFVESVLRYGLPPDFKYIIIKGKKDEKKLFNLLTKAYESSTSAPAFDASAVDDGDDFRNFVYTKIDLEFSRVSL